MIVSPTSAGPRLTSRERAARHGHPHNPSFTSGGSHPDRLDAFMSLFSRIAFATDSSAKTLPHNTPAGVTYIPDDNLIPQPFSRPRYNPRLKVRVLLPSSLISIADLFVPERRDVLGYVIREHILTSRFKPGQEVAVGAISCYLDHFVISRILRYAYGTPGSTKYDPLDPDHHKRSHKVRPGASKEFESMVWRVWRDFNNLGPRILLRCRSISMATHIKLYSYTAGVAKHGVNLNWAIFRT